MIRFNHNVPKPSPLLKNIKLAPVIYLYGYSSIDYDVDNMLVIKDNEGKHEFYFINELAAVIACDPIDLYNITYINKIVIAHTIILIIILIKICVKVKYG